MEHMYNTDKPEDTKVIDTLYDNVPYFSKEFLEHMKDAFDIRKSVWYEQDLGILKGIQNVITYMDNAHQAITNKAVGDE